MLIQKLVNIGLAARRNYRQARLLSATVWQEACAVNLAEEALRIAERRDEYQGTALYNLLPSDMSSILVNQPYDPYNKYFDKRDLYRWITEHVFFDEDNNVVGFFDNGVVIIARDGYYMYVEKFARAKKEVDHG